MLHAVKEEGEQLAPRDRAAADHRPHGAVRVVCRELREEEAVGRQVRAQQDRDAEEAVLHNAPAVLRRDRLAQRRQEARLHACFLVSRSFSTSTQLLHFE